MLQDPLFKPLEDVVSQEFTIPAGVTIPIASKGEFVRCLESTADIKISFNGGSKVIFGQGLGRFTNRGARYESFELHNDTGSDVTVKIVYGFGNVQDQRLSVTAPLNIASPGSLITPAHVSVAGLSSSLVSAANSTKKEVIIRNPLTNTHNFYVGDSSVDTSHGWTIQPGEGITLTTSGAVYAYNSKSSTQNIQVGETR